MAHMLTFGHSGIQSLNIQVMQTGTINVQTENIFPIIKQFLYSDHEIFLRELVANAVDATQKMKTLKSVGELKTDLSKLKVEVILDKDAKTITVRDNGIGMTGEEVDKYINQIAFSGAEEFVEKYKDKADQIIGHFGLGFYSAFMVASKVEIISRSQLPNSVPVKWSCDGSPNYTLEETQKKTKGTDIVLHVSDDSMEFLSESRLTEILTRYCKFLPVPVKFGMKDEWKDDPSGEKDDKGKVKQIKSSVDNIINNPNPAWSQKPADLTEEDYKNFYRELYPSSFEDPLFSIHLNVDYPFNLTGILYFPKIKTNVEVQKNKINLYSNQVFITDNVENIVPEFLTLLHGVIDSPDIPLNVSRSYLQSDANVKKISGHITKKVADKLASMFKEDREDFQEKWSHIKIFIEYGMLSEQKFYDKASTFALYKTTDDKYYTLEEYLAHVGKTQLDKNSKTILLYTSDVEEQHAYIQNAKDRGYDVLVLDGPLISHLMSRLETDNTDVLFARVDSDTIDKLIDKEDALPSKLSETEQESLKAVVEDIVPKEKFSVTFESMSEKDSPMMITQSEFMRRMKEQQSMGGGGMFGQMPEMYNLVVNSNHPLISSIIGQSDDEAKKKLAKQAVDLAMLAQGMLKGQAMTDFIKRSVEIIE
jgi:molecular chaperone HtpG